MVLGALMLLIPFTRIITLSSIQIFVLIIGLLLLLFGFPILLNSNKD